MLEHALAPRCVKGVMLHCICRLMCRFSAAGNDDLTTRSGGRRLESAKARNRVGRWRAGSAAGGRGGKRPWGFGTGGGAGGGEAGARRVQGLFGGAGKMSKLAPTRALSVDGSDYGWSWLCKERINPS